MIGILKESIWQFLNLNAVLGILGIFALGIFLAWYINATLLIPIPKRSTVGIAGGAPRMP